jgi:hypothetical protein
MSATSVTGNGKGAGFPNRGAQNGRDTFIPLLSPHVVAAGIVTLDDNYAEVKMPTALTSTSENDYVIFVTPQESVEDIPYVSDKTFDDNDNLTGFTVNGSNAAHAWVVVKAGVK